MLTRLTNQKESDDQFRLWVDTLIDGSTPNGNGWVIEGTGVAFNNYGHGKPGTINNEVMLGVDPESGNSVVKIVRPVTSQRDLGKQTAIACDDDGNHFLLRQGRLQRNRISRAITADFASLTGLGAVPVNVTNTISNKKWYIVADLAAASQKIIDGTTEFAFACARARSKVGGGTAGSDGVESSVQECALGVDEQGRTIKVKHPGWSKEINLLHGYVWQAIKKLTGNEFRKLTKNGFAVDGVIESANLLIEIKTGVSAHNIYEAVGQLRLYPSLVGLDLNLDPVLLVPNCFSLKPAMAAALSAAEIGVYTYSIESNGKKPKITFSKKFLNLCGL